MRGPENFFNIIQNKLVINYIYQDKEKQEIEQKDDVIRRLTREYLGPSFEVFIEMNPKCDYSRLEDEGFVQELIKQIRAKVDFSKSKGPSKPPPQEPPIILDDEDYFIESPLDIERDPEQAFLLIYKFFDLPILEKEAYLLRIKNNEKYKEIVNYSRKIKEIRYDKVLSNENRDNKIEELEKLIKELEDEIIKNSDSNLSEIFSNYGILSLQRRAAIRIKLQWHNIQRKLNKNHID